MWWFRSPLSSVLCLWSLTRPGLAYVALLRGGGKLIDPRSNICLWCIRWWGQRQDRLLLAAQGIVTAAHKRRPQQEGRTFTTMHGSTTAAQCGLLVLVLVFFPFSPSHGAHAFVSTPSAGVAAVSRQAHPASSLTPSPSAITMAQPRRWTPAAFSRSHFEVRLHCRPKRIKAFSSDGFV